MHLNFTSALSYQRHDTALTEACVVLVKSTVHSPACRESVGCGNEMPRLDQQVTASPVLCSIQRNQVRNILIFRNWTRGCFVSLEHIIIRHLKWR